MGKHDQAPGLVVLLGAGAGGEALLTAAGSKWLSRAEVVVYDRLADPALLRLCPGAAEKIHVGKTPGGAGPDQKWISDLLVRRGLAGQLVVRLKGGDPFIFGRGGEEAEALAQAGVPYRVVPGVTAALAAAASAGIPLTDRRYAGSVALVTGRRDSARGDQGINFQALAGIDTVVFYMGVGALADITGKLIQAGRDPQTPSAIVALAGTANQQTITAPLSELAERARDADIRPPAVAIVGEVVSLRDRLAWMEKLPLFAQTIIVTRPAAQAAELSHPLVERGAAVIEAPTIEILPCKDYSAADDALGRMAEFELVAFTSVNGVAAFADRCCRLGLDGRALAGAKVAAVGPATAEALRKNFIEPDIVPQAFTTEALAEAVLAAGPIAGRRALLVRADAATPNLGRALRRAGAHIEEPPFYRIARPTALPEAAVAALRGRSVDWVCFTCSSSVTNFVALLGAASLDVGTTLAGVELAAIGPVTAEALAGAGLRAAVVADPHTIAGLVEAITESSAGK